MALDRQLLIRPAGAGGVFIAGDRGGFFTHLGHLRAVDFWQLDLFGVDIQGRLVGKHPVAVGIGVLIDLGGQAGADQRSAKQ